MTVVQMNREFKDNLSTEIDLTSQIVEESARELNATGKDLNLIAENLKTQVDKFKV